MKTNSKLTKRVLAIALAVCMLCSVLVAGIGTGITAKAAEGSLELYVWGFGSVEGKQTVTADGTYTFTFSDTSSLAGTTGGENYFNGNLLDCYATADETAVSATITADIADANGDTVLSIGHAWGSGEEVNWGSTMYAYKFGANSWDSAYAAYTWTGTETVTVNVKVSGITWPTEEETTTPSDTEETTTPSDTEEEVDVDFSKKTADSGYTAAISYGSNNDWGNSYWGGGSGDSLVNGDGTYSVYFAGVNGDPVWVLAVDISGFAAACEEQGVSVSDITVSNVKVICDNTSISVDNSKVAYGDLEGNGNLRIELFNEWGSTKGNAPVDLSEVVFSKMLKVEFTLSGIGKEITGGTEAPEEEEKPTVVPGSKKENGYIHDKGAIFVYTGDKDINDFTVMAGWLFGAIHEARGEWGATYEDVRDLKSNGIYTKYWEDYRGIGYPAIQFSWDTDRIFYISQLTVHSSDWTVQTLIGEADGFYRGPAERYEGTGEKLIDGGNRWYYFGEGSYKGAAATEDTTTEETPVEDTTTEAPANAGTVNVTGEGEYYAFVAIGADNVANDWAYSWAGDEAAPTAGITANAVKAKLGEQFTISIATDTPVYYTWYVSPTIIAGAGKTAVDFTIDDIRLDGKSVMNIIDFEADGVQWWYEGTGNYTVDEAIRLYGGYNEWGTKYFTESPAGYSLIEYDITINSIA